MHTLPGKLYGIGVGPGDPELMTLKAVCVLKKVDAVYAAASTKNDYSLAVNVAKAHIPHGTLVVHLAFPMTRDLEETGRTWQQHARTLLAELENGRSAAFLTLGDPMTYSTFGYLVKNIRVIAPDIAIETVPGITSYHASAARLNTPLVEGEESLLITSGVKGGDRFRSLGGKPENVVFLKAYRNIRDISNALQDADMLGTSVGVSHCCLPQEEIIPDIRDLENRKPGYWTLIIAKRQPSAPAAQAPVS
jgi:precorrin-2/cobalt-factor-2 C20-methyltransferase